ncbi:hypothetical protein RF11_08307 [Thelohanellus kitauei]|uniref:Alpha-soluble NSF attachment protein n=1 Tax=Thelohanellus kitauei TaxID=669202 RepID=A0A0C2NF29_THEKT|nr:hypothetical protein RF11_08307 [Thelohanellus kitauei]
MRDRFWDLINRGREFEDSKNFEEAGNVYHDAAKVAEVYTDEPEEAFNRYNQSAKCFLNIKSNRAFTCYQKAVCVYLRNVSWVVTKRVISIEKSNFLCYMDTSVCKN